MGSVPPWYPIVAAARYLGVSPWELENASLLWMHRAIAAQNAEAHAEEMHAKHAK